MMHRTNVSQHAQVLQSVQFQLLLPASMNSKFRGNRRGNRHAIFIGALPHQPPRRARCIRTTARCSCGVGKCQDSVDEAGRFTEFVSTFRSTHNGIQPQQSSFADGLAGAWWCNVHIAIVSTDFHGFRMISARCRLFAASVTAESRFVLSALLSAAVNTIFVACETSNKKN